jgi:hypothetical protein
MKILKYYFKNQFHITNLIFIFSPLFKLKSRLLEAVLSKNLLAFSSLSFSFLNSDKATLKSKASLRSSKAIPINACLPC